jgi:ribosomal protein S10
MAAIDHCERETMQVLQDMTSCSDAVYMEYLQTKRSELAERLAMAHLAFGKELETEKDYDGAIDTYAKAIKALENADNPNEELASKICKARGLAMTKRVDRMINLKDLDKRRGEKVSDLEFHADLGRAMSQARERAYQIKSKDSRKADIQANGRPLQIARTVSKDQSKIFRPLETPIHLVDPTGRFVIKKNNFIVNHRPSLGAVPSNTNELSASNVKGPGLVDTLDIGDIDSNPETIDDVFPPDLQKTRKPRAVSAHMKPNALGQQSSQNADLYDNIPAAPQTPQQPLFQSRPFQNKTTLHLRQNHGPFLDPAQQADEEELMKGVISREKINPFAEEIAKTQPRMYKVAGGHMNLPVTKDETIMVLENQKRAKDTFSNVEKDEHERVKEEWQERVKEERMSFLTHLMTGKPMTTKRPAFGRNKEADQKKLSDSKLHLRIPIDGDSKNQSELGDSPRRHSKDPSGSQVPGEVGEDENNDKINGFFNKIQDQAAKLREKESAMKGKRVNEGDAKDEESSESFVSGADKGKEDLSE